MATNDAIHNSNNYNHAQDIISMMRKENKNMKKIFQSMVKVVQQIGQKKLGGGRTYPTMSKPQPRGYKHANGIQHQIIHSNTCG